MIYRNTAKIILKVLIDSHLISSIGVILQCHGTFVTTRKQTLVHSYSLNSILYSSVASFSSSILFLVQDPMQNTALVIMSSLAPLGYDSFTDFAFAYFND